MTDNKIMTIRLVPDGFYVSERFYPIAPGADFEQRLEETMLDAEIAILCENGNTFSDEESTQVHCLIETSRFCLSPISETTEMAEEMFHLANADKTQEEVVLHDTDDSQQIRFTYAMTAKTYHFLRRTLPGVEMHLDACELHQAHAIERGIFVKADKSAISLLAYQNGKLQVCNRIETQGENNQSYFILTTWSHLGFDPIEDPLYLETDNERLRQTLNTYIKCVL